MRGVPRSLLVLGVCVVLLALPSTGAVPLRESDGTVIKWFLGVPGQANIIGGKITYYLHPLGSLDVPSSIDELKAVRKAFDTWEEVETSGLAFLEDDSRIALAHNATDRVNLIRWESGTIDPFTLALTYPTSVGGVMSDADLILNDNFKWETTTPGTQFTADVESVVVHEIGHMLGLDHVPHGRSTMFYELPLGAIKARTLEPDDMAGITALYPDPDTTSDRGSIRGRVRVSGKGDDRGVLVVALDLFHRLPAASTLSVSGGQYEIPQMLPGQYVVLALPITAPGTMVPYWHSSRTDVFGQSWGSNGQNPGRPQLVRIKPGSTTYGIDFLDLEATKDRNEPNNGPLQAVPIRMNEVAFGLAENNLDSDWYVFEAEAGQRVSVHVDAWHLGGDMNPTLEIYATDGATLLARCVDIRPKIEEENLTSIDGVDSDAWIESLIIKNSGRHYIRVQISPNSNTGTPSNYYVVSLFADPTAPDDEATEVTAWPPAIPADGEYQTVLTIRPRNLIGDLLAAESVTIEITGDGLGTVSDVTALVSGTYTAAVTAPTVPGSETFDISLRTDTGSVEIPDAVRINYLGPPDKDRSSFRADPGRIEADGVSTAVLVLKAQDSHGAVYGPGLPVEITFQDDPDGLLSYVSDEGSGVYSATVTAPDLSASDSFQAKVAGRSLNRAAVLHYGFSLPEVLTDALEDLDTILEGETLSKARRRRLGKARARIESTLTLLDGGPRGESKALLQLVKFVKLYRRGTKKTSNAVPDLPSAVSMGARQFTNAVLGAISFNPPNAKGESRLKKAKRAELRGTTSLENDRHDRALRRFAKALRIAVRIR